MLKNFFTIAWRNLAKHKTLAILNISGLAIGIVVCLVIGVWLQRELSFDDFHPNGNNIFRVSNTFRSESEEFSQAPSASAFGVQLPKLLPSIKAGCRVFPSSAKLTSGDKHFFENEIANVDPNFFQFFGFHLIQGQAQDALNEPGKIVLTEKTAIKYFGTTQAIGKTMLVDDKYPVTVSGIAANVPPNSHIQFDLLLSCTLLKKIIKENYGGELDNEWVGGWPATYVQLTDAHNANEVEKQINVVALKNAEKEWKENKMSYHYFLQPLRDIHLKSHLRYDAGNNGSMATVSIFSIVGIIVLLLAIINYVNLTTAGAIKRAKETAVRKVVGAMRMQLVSQFFFETLIICTAAFFIGILAFKTILPFFSQWIGQPYSFTLSLANILLIVGCILFISLVAGIYPAVILSSFNPATSLKGAFLQSKQGVIIRKSLVVFQFTITIALVASILIITQQMNFIKNKSLGFDDKAVIEVNFGGDSSVIQKYAAMRSQLLQNPFIYNITKHDGNIVGGLGNGWTTTQNLKGEEISTSLYQIGVDSNYFNTYNMQLAAGRFFSKVVSTDSASAVLVNEAAVKVFGWGNAENALGKKFGKDKNIKYVIGVVKNFNFESLHKPVEALLIKYVQSGSSLSVKTDASHIKETIAKLEATWRSFVPGVPLQFSMVDDRIGQQYGSEQKMEGIFLGFSALSLLIACLGLFGLSIFVVERKIKEIGIRKVLGASVSGIVSLLSADFLKLVAIALVIACPLAFYFMSNWLQNFAYRININGWIFVASGIIAFLIALITVSVKAIKAALTNPVKSLRTE